MWSKTEIPPLYVRQCSLRAVLNFCAGVPTDNGILLLPLHLVAETKTKIEYSEPEIRKVHFTFTKHATHGFEKLDHL